MKTGKQFLYRAAIVCYVDSLFYEPGDLRRSHNRCHAAITQRLFGIGEDTHRNYLRRSEAELAGYRPAPDIKSLLRLYVFLRKAFSTGDTTLILDSVYRIIARELGQAPSVEGGRKLSVHALREALLHPASDKRSGAKE